MMYELTKFDEGQVGGGFAQVVAIIGAVWLGVEIADAAYQAGKAFEEGYAANDKL